MQRRRALALPFVILLFGLAAVAASDVVMATEPVKVHAMVIAIDKPQRRIVPRDTQAKGNVVTVRVPATLPAFDEHQVGDTIVAGYTEAATISVRSPASKK
jgi:hypothetical protein